MREIKFRAWHKQNSQMLEVTRIDFIEKTVMLNPNPKEPRVAYCDLEDVELMQSTGVHDKNDTEIYEGDVLKKRTMRTGRQDFGKTIRAVRWTPSRNGWNFIYGESWEVIGNIYENSELLKQKLTG